MLKNLQIFKSLVRIQVALLSVTAIFLGFYSGISASFSVLLGGICSIIPGILAAVYFFPSSKSTEKPAVKAGDLAKNASIDSSALKREETTGETIEKTRGKTREGALNHKKILHKFYLAETLKLLFTLLLFTVSLQWSKLNGVGFFLGFISAEAAYWLILKRDL